ncbi:O-antigen ligase family protein [Candidatus Woesearchaeota archaeon]|nr:O-antigen ligase family protein [Candidatus Woesearchaeota archaeon]
MCSEKKVRALSWILLFVVASVAFRLYSHVYSYDQAFEGFENNYLARILSFYVPFLLGMLWAEKKKLFKFFIFAVFAFTLQGITQLGSRATYVAVGIALALLGIMNLNKKSTWIFAGLGVIFFMFFVPPIFYRDITSISYAAEGTESEEYSIRGRAIAAEYGMKIFSEQPITGFGVAQARYEKLLEERFGLFKSGHNAFVIIAVELGIFGLLIYISLFAVSILYCFRARIMTRKTNRYISSLANGTMFGLIGIGINQFMLNNPWIPTAFIGFALSSVLYTLAKEQKKKDLEKIAKSEEKPEIKTEKKK